MATQVHGSLAEQLESLGLLKPSATTPAPAEKPRAKSKAAAKRPKASTRVKKAEKASSEPTMVTKPDADVVPLKTTLPATAKYERAQPKAQAKVRRMLKRSILWYGPVSLLLGKGTHAVSENTLATPICIGQTGIVVYTLGADVKKLEPGQSVTGLLILFEEQFSDGTRYLVGEHCPTDAVEAAYELGCQANPQATAHPRQVKRIDLPVARYGFIEILSIDATARLAKAA